MPLLTSVLCSLLLLAGAAPASTPVTSSPANSRAPAWQPTGDLIVFESDRRGDWDLYLTTVDGSDVRQLTDDPGDDRYPAWSPDGRQVVFVSNRTGTPELHLLTVSGGDVHLLAKITGRERFPSWSQSGDWIAFSREQNGSMGIFRVWNDGAELEPVVEGPAQYVWPRWSPKGEVIAYFSRQDERDNDEIYLHALNTRMTVRVTNKKGHDFCPAWSPDGEMLAISAIDADDKRTIRIIDLDGNVIETFAAEFYRATEPVWSRDGAAIAFAGRPTSNDTYQIFLHERIKGSSSTTGP